MSQQILKDKRFHTVQGRVTRLKTVQPVLANAIGRFLLTNPSFELTTSQLNAETPPRDASPTETVAGTKAGEVLNRSRALPMWPDNYYLINQLLRLGMDNALKSDLAQGPNSTETPSNWMTRANATGCIGATRTSLGDLSRRYHRNMDDEYTRKAVERFFTSLFSTGASCLTMPDLMSVYKHAPSVALSQLTVVGDSLTPVLDKFQDGNQGHLSAPSIRTFPGTWLAVDPRVARPYDKGSPSSIRSRDLFPFGNPPHGPWAEMLGLKPAKAADNKGLGGACMFQDMMELVLRLDWMINVNNILRSNSIWEVLTSNLPDVLKRDRNVIARIRAFTGVVIMKIYTMAPAVVAANLLKIFLNWEPVREAYRHSWRDEEWTAFHTKVDGIASLPLPPLLAQLGRNFGNGVSSETIWGQNLTDVLPVDLGAAVLGVKNSHGSYEALDPSAIKTLAEGDGVNIGAGRVGPTSAQVLTPLFDLKTLHDMWDSGRSLPEDSTVTKLYSSGKAIELLTMITSRASFELKEAFGSAELTDFYTTVASLNGWRAWDRLSPTTMHDPKKEALVVSVGGISERLPNTLDISAHATLRVEDVVSPDFEVKRGLAQLSLGTVLTRMIPVPVSTTSRMERLTNVMIRPGALIALEPRSDLLAKLTREGIDVRSYENTLGGLAEAMCVTLTDLVADVAAYPSDYDHLGALSSKEGRWIPKGGNKTVLITTSAFQDLAANAGIVYARQEELDVVISRGERLLARTPLQTIASVIGPDVPDLNVDPLAAGSGDFAILGIKGI